MDAVAQALADPIRRALLLRLRGGPVAAGDLAADHDVSRPAVSRHLRVLREAGLVRVVVDGRTHAYHLERRALHELQRFIAALATPTPLATSADRWQRRFDALDTEVHRTRRARKRDPENHAKTDTKTDTTKQKNHKREKSA